MKKITIIKVSVLVVCLAASIAAARDDMLLDQLGLPGSWGDTCVQFGSSNDRWIADDFITEVDCTVETFVCQFVSSGVGTVSFSGFRLEIFADTLGEGPVWEAFIPARDVDVTVAGDPMGAFRVYSASISLNPADYFYARSGTTYWVAWQIQDASNCRNMTVHQGDSDGSQAWEYFRGSWREIGDIADAAVFLGGTKPGEICMMTFGYIKALYR
ncbi:MAG: hypothetical protein NTW26_10385 [bacterium]|nr:hypothetical protein [bacterium]